MTANEIRDLRVRLRLSQRVFAERLHVHRVTVVNWEKGKKQPMPFLVLAMRELAVPTQAVAS